MIIPRLIALQQHNEQTRQWICLGILNDKLITDKCGKGRFSIDLHK